MGTGVMSMMKHCVVQGMYDENTYRRILELITDSGILVDINHDSKECSRLGRRLQRDLNKICRYVRINDQS